MSKTPLHLVILAAGKGTRMNAVDKTKVMFPLHGQPMIGLFVPTIAELKPDTCIFVVGFHGQQVIDYMSALGEYDYVWQREQLGTGHALMQARAILHNKTGITLVCNGDNPLFSVATMKKMMHSLVDEHAVVAIASSRLDPEKFPFGRIVCDATGHVIKVVEVKNCTPEELTIPDLNSGLYAFDNTWLWNNIDTITRNSVSNEFYITDLIEIANNDGKRVIAVPVARDSEAIGINTLDNLAQAEDALAK